MEYRVLGKTGLKISRLGFGGIPIQRIDAEGTKALMHQMKDAGAILSVKSTWATLWKASGSTSSSPPRAWPVPKRLWLPTSTSA